MGAIESTIENTIANFLIIITRCGEFGPKYNPGNDLITILKMTTQHGATESLQNDYVSSLEATRALMTIRDDKFNEMKLLATRSINIFESTEASKSAIKKARGYIKKIGGNHKKIKKLDNGLPDPKSVSQSQRGFVNLVSHFKKLIEVYSADGHYVTNEDIMKLTSLTTMAANLIQANDDVDESNAVTITKRLARNYALYVEKTGVIDISLACKKYVRGLFGPKSPEAKSIVSVKMRRAMRIKPAQQTL
jgi:phosphotransferase system HPr-like phosphotransfer protein